MKIKTKKMSKKILAGAFALSLAFPLGNLTSNNAKALEGTDSKYEYSSTFRTDDNKPIRTDDGWWHLSTNTSVSNLNELEFADYELFNCYFHLNYRKEIVNNPQTKRDLEELRKKWAGVEKELKTGKIKTKEDEENLVYKYFGFNRDLAWTKSFIETEERDLEESMKYVKNPTAVRKYEAKYRSVAKKEIDKLEYLSVNQKEEAKRKIENVKDDDIRFKCEDILKEAKQLNEKNKAEGKKPEVNNSNVTPETKASWQSNSTGWWYQNADGSYPVSEWKQINGEWYWFDESGYMQIAWQSVAGTWYYFTESGAMAHDTWIDGTYYVASNGAMLTNTTTPDGYTVGSDGAWLQNTGSWQSNSTGWWYQNADGSYPANEWKQINGSWYYFNESGYMVASMWIGNYYLGGNGAMLTNTTTPDGYVVDENGLWIA